MTKDTGLREEECLGESSENLSALLTETHTDYNVSPRKSTKPQQTADRGLRKFKIQNPKQIQKTEILEGGFRDSFMLSLFVI